MVLRLHDRPGFLQSQKKAAVPIFLAVRRRLATGANGTMSSEKLANPADFSGLSRTAKGIMKRPHRVEFLNGQADRVKRDTAGASALLCTCSFPGPDVRGTVMRSGSLPVHPTSMFFS